MKQDDWYIVGTNNNTDDTAEVGGYVISTSDLWKDVSDWSVKMTPVLEDKTPFQRMMAEAIAKEDFKKLLQEVIKEELKKAIKEALREIKNG